MNLTKAKLVKSIKIGLNQLGYNEVIDTVTGSNGLFIKPINNGYFLTLGLTISRYETSMFTGTFYLSKVTRWGTMYGDIPRESYQRIGHFLTKQERFELLDKEYTLEGVEDAWWNGNDTIEINKFIKTVSITEKRFLEQKDLFSKIEKSTEINELQAYSIDVIKLINLKIDNVSSFNHIPNKSIDGVPIEWFKTAESVIISKKGILNDNTVKLLAIDAWRQKMFRSSV